MKCPYCHAEVKPIGANCPKCKAAIVKKETKPETNKKGDESNGS